MPLSSPSAWSCFSSSVFKTIVPLSLFILIWRFEQQVGGVSVLAIKVLAHRDYCTFTDLADTENRTKVWYKKNCSGPDRTWDVLLDAWLFACVDVSSSQICRATSVSVWRPSVEETINRVSTWRREETRFLLHACVIHACLSFLYICVTLFLKFAHGEGCNKNKDLVV